ncbi:MAG: PilN domain-containing protein [Deltaproteobacteria bacterium]|nr:PilN domain-containing protein [Deltaproteobacteria bacterium]
MIKINLLGDQESANSSAQLQIGLFIGSLAICFAVFFGVNYWFSGQLEELNNTATRLQAELQKKQRITAEVREYEAKKDDYNRKLLVIATLKKNKTGPVRVMDDLNGAIPERAWVTEIKEDNGIFKVSGKALDNQTISSFIRELDKSDYFGEVGREIIKLAEHEGVKIREFSFEAEVRYAGNVQIKEDDLPGSGRRASLSGERFVFNLEDAFQSGEVR